MVYTEFHQAVEANDVDRIHELMRKHGHENTYRVLAERDSNGRTAMHLAALHGHAKVLLPIIEQAFNYADRKDRNGWTPQHYACHSKCAEVVKMFNNQACDTPTDDGYYPLHIAASNGFAEGVKVLCQAASYKSAINATAKNKQTPLLCAIAGGHIEAAKELLHYGADPKLTTEGRCSPLVTAIIKGHEKIAVMLIDAGADINEKVNLNLSDSSYIHQYNVFTLAIKYLLPLVVAKLLEKDVDPYYDPAGKYTDGIPYDNEQGEFLNNVFDVVSVLNKKGVNVVKLSDMLNLTSYDKNNSLLEQVLVNTHGEFGDIDVSSLIEHGAIENLSLLHREGFNINSLHDDSVEIDDNLTPLHLIAFYKPNNWSRMIDLFVSVGVDLNQKISPSWKLQENVWGIWSTDPRDESALEIAIRRKHYEVASYLLQLGADANVETSDRVPLLHHIVENLPLLREFLKFGADIDAIDEEKNTVLHRAMTRTQSVEVIPLLRTVINATNADNTTALAIAVSINRVDLVQALLEQKASPSSGLFAVACTGNIAIARILAKEHDQLCVRDAYMQTPLHVAITYKNYNLVELLATEDVIAATNRDGKTPLDLAVDAPANVVARLRPATIDNRWTTLHEAAQNGDLATVTQKLPITVDGFQRTPLHVAARCGFSEGVKNLLGPHLDAKDRSQRTALHESAANGHTTCVEILLDAGADVKTTDTYGRTALHLAATHGHAAVIRLLLQYGASPQKDRMKQTPKECALSNGHYGCAKLF